MSLAEDPGSSNGIPLIGSEKICYGAAGCWTKTAEFVKYQDDHCESDFAVNKVDEENANYLEPFLPPFCRLN